MQREMFSKPRRHTQLKGDGYAASPGSGRKGETCGTCAHVRRCTGGTARWNKCAMVKRAWDRSTDIRLDAPACLHWVLGVDNDNKT